MNSLANACPCNKSVIFPWKCAVTRNFYLICNLIWTDIFKCLPENKQETYLKAVQKSQKDTLLPRI